MSHEFDRLTVCITKEVNFLPESLREAHSVIVSDWSRAALHVIAEADEYLGQQVAQGQYVVSDTRCPALHDCELEREEAGQRPQRGRSPVEHRGTFVHSFIRSFVHALLRLGFVPNGRDLSLEAGI